MVQIFLDKVIGNGIDLVNVVDMVFIIVEITQQDGLDRQIILIIILDGKLLKF
uniref:Uncharacterized protein n=1 Tax=Myoviridae sp. ctCo31 TaxID=2825053 RepID=A0A8S5UM92_9CAUD|nr:MAG TPA: hypothetical protein [Myoviridae sp. ctCo31]